MFVEFEKYYKSHSTVVFQSDLVICNIDEDLLKKIKKFKMRKEKNIAAIISKCEATF